MERREYNGWTNYETWVVALWIDNDQGSHGYWSERAEYLFRLCNDKDEAAQNLADELKDQHEEGNPCGDSGVYSDLMSAALSEVNWREIAEHYTNEVEIEEDEESEVEA